MHISYLISFFSYLAVLTTVGVFFHLKQKHANDFMLGDRSLNYWVTAIATHATDMSTWLFMAFPGLIYREGLMGAWVAIGLIIGMYLTWFFIAPKIRAASEKLQTPTLPSYFEKRFNDQSGIIQLASAIIALVFFTFYIAAGIAGLGQTVQLTFGIDYHTAILIGTLVVSAYTLLGGFVAVAWNDFLQGMFVLLILIIVPMYGIFNQGGITSIINAIQTKNISLSLFPDYSLKNLFYIFSLATGWGLGYFGLPHVIVNFMGIDDVKNLKKSRRLGIAWQIIALGSAVLIGLIGVSYFAQTGLANSEHVFIVMTQTMFSPALAGLIMCAILAAAITTMDSQILVSASIIAEDLYKRFFNKTVSPKTLLYVSQLGGVAITGVAFCLAYNNNRSILDLVLKAWSGLGGAFGPLLIASFYFPIHITRNGALAGLLVGGFTAGLWEYLDIQLVLPLIPAYILSLAAIALVSSHGKKKSY